MVESPVSEPNIGLVKPGKVLQTRIRLKDVPQGMGHLDGNDLLLAAKVELPLDGKMADTVKTVRKLRSLFKSLFPDTKVTDLNLEQIAQLKESMK